VAAVSLDLDGVGFCCGTAARARLDEAACAALLELCQNELAYAVVQAKRAERGDAALNARDLAMLQRLGRVRAEPAWLIHPAGAPAGAALTGAEPEARMAALGQRLTEAGLELLLFDHSGNTDGMAVWRAVCEGLACEPSSDTPPRLARAIRETGGGPGINAGVPLFI
jgi:ribosomal protein S12 methylthiotransferase accessory factor